MPAEDARHTRYLAIQNFPEAERLDAWRISSVHLNGFSEESEMSFPQFVPGTANSVLRIDMRNYRSPFKTQWEKLGEFDPYFHVRLTPRKASSKILRMTDAKGHKWFARREEDEWELEYENTPNGLIRRAVVPEGESEGPGGPRDNGVALAPWLSSGDAQAKALAYLVERTQSKSPVLKADWFFRHTAVQETDKNGGKMPGYYDFMGFKEQKDYEQAVGFDLKLVRTTFKDETAAAIGRSTVSLNNRRLLRFGKVGGGIWWTLDSSENVGKKNYLQVLDTDRKVKTFHDAIAQKDEFTATESLAHLPNGLLAAWLADNEGKRQNSAPDFIATDGRAPGTDRRVHINMSCIRCHVAGIQPIDDWVRKLVRDPLELKVADYDDFKRLRQLYVSDLQGKVKADQEIYAKAIAKASGGLSTELFARKYASFWSRYQDEDYDLERISLETGVPRDKLLTALDAITRKTGGINPVLAGLLRGLVKGDEALAIRSEQFEEVYPLLMTHLAGYVK